MVKLPLVAASARDAGLASLVDPGTIDPALLRRLHNPAYVDAFLAGVPPHASAQGWPWSPQIRDGVLAIHAGQLLGARLALTRGLAANIAQGFGRYRAALDDAFATLAAWRPDLVLYQAGADPHEDDPLGSLRLSTAQLFERDLAVFRWSLAARLPLLFVLAGGYQTPIETRQLPLHLNTFRAAAQALREHPPAQVPYVPPAELAPTGNPSQLPPQ